MQQPTSDRVIALRTLRDKYLPELPQYTRDSSYGPIEGTKQANHEAALTSILSRAQPPRTALDQEISFLKSLLESSHDATPTFAQAPPCDITFIPPGTTQKAQVGVALRNGCFPIFAPGFNPTACEMTLATFCVQVALIPEGTQFVGATDASMAEGSTFDSDHTSPRDSTPDEFVAIFTGEQQCEQPVNFLDLKNMTGSFFTPQVVNQNSLEYNTWNDPTATASKIYNETPQRWLEEFFIATTKDGFSHAHRDKVGYCTWAMVTEGAKLWLIPRQRRNLESDFGEHGSRGLPVVKEQEWVGVKLCPGDLWIQGPGQIHAVWTLDDTLMIGGQFWTASSFARTIDLLDVDELRGSWENEDALEKDYETLTEILEKQSFDHRYKLEVHTAIARLFSAHEGLESNPKIKELGESREKFIEVASKLKDLSEITVKRSWDEAMGNPVLNDENIPTAQPPPEGLPPQKPKARQNPKSSGSRKPKPKKRK